MADQSADGDQSIDNLFNTELGQRFNIRDLDRHNNNRRNSLAWILKAYEHHRFKPATALRAVMYFDHYLSIFNVPADEAWWRYLLVAMACLSVAARIDEPGNRPSVIDLQVPVVAFPALVVFKMEFNVMRRLEWDLRCVTPFDFRDYFLSRLPSPAPLPAGHIAFNFSDLAVKTARAGDFQRYLPSEIAAAAVVLILAAGGTDELPDAFYERVNKVTVTACRQQLEGHLMETCSCADCSAALSNNPPPAGEVTGDMSTGDAVEDDEPEGPVNKRPRFGNPDA